MHEMSTCSLYHFSQRSFTRRQSGLAEDQLSTGLLDVCNLRTRGIAWHDHVSIEPANFGSECNSSTVVSGRMRCNRRDVARYRERKNGVEGAAIFERTAVLKVLALKDDAPIRTRIQSG
jgi:hypothetical protein